MNRQADRREVVEKHTNIMLYIYILSYGLAVTPSMPFISYNLKYLIRYAIDMPCK